jgi:CheY-like chemotaxis protein
MTGKAVNGQEALEALRRETFDIVLLDMHMPVMDGPTRCDQNGSAPRAAITVSATVSIRMRKNSSDDDARVSIRMRKNSPDDDACVSIRMKKNPPDDDVALRLQHVSG